MKNDQFFKGYSLIEIMVVMSLFALLMLVTTQTLLLSLRNTSKSETVSKVKENLEYPISIIERQLRSAKDIPLCTNTLTPFAVLEYIANEGISSNFSCADIGTDDGYIASGSSRLTNSEVNITSCSFGCIRESGIPPKVTISLKAQDKGQVTGAERAQFELETTVLLRQF